MNKGTSFKDYGIEVETGVNEDDDGTSGQEPSLNLAQIQKGFLLSRIVVPELPSPDDDGVDADDIHQELSRTGINILPIDEEDQKKFGMKLHPLHEEHLSRNT